MWFRFTVIAILKWFVLFILSALILHFLIPASWTGYQIAVPMWLLAFVVAFCFAQWALRKRLPEPNVILSLFVIWMAVTVTLQLLYAQFMLGSVLFVTNSLDIYIQYLLEIAALFLSSHLTQKRKMRSVLSEGIAE